MTAKRRLLIASGLILASGVGWFYWFYFKSPEAVLRHAEAFHLRRMTVAQLETGRYRHFYATNRQRDAGRASLEDGFTRERASELAFGSFDTSLTPTLGLGMMINPTEWFQNEEIRLDEIRALGQGDFVAALREVVDRTPGRSLTIIVHGFRERFSSALRKTAFVASVVDVNSPMLVFDWPGNQGSSLGGYRRAREVAEASGVDLARVLEIVVRDVQPDRLALIANSMGAQVVVDAFGLLYEQPDFADFDTEILDVVLTAPDVDHAEFDRRFKDEITALTRSLTVYVSSNDRALLMSRVVNRGKRAGESTFSPDQFEEAARLLELADPGDERMAIVDVTPVNRTRNFHNFSLETPEFYDDLFLRLVTDDLPRNRLIYPVETGDGSIYWVLTRGR